MRNPVVYYDVDPVSLIGNILVVAPIHIADLDTKHRVVEVPLETVRDILTGARSAAHFCVLPDTNGSPAVFLRDEHNIDKMLVRPQLIRIASFDPDAELSVCVDLDLCTVTVAERHSATNLPELLDFYLVHADNPNDLVDEFTIPSSRLLREHEMSVKLLRRRPFLALMTPRVFASYSFKELPWPE